MSYYTTQTKDPDTNEVTTVLRNSEGSTIAVITDEKIIPVGSQPLDIEALRKLIASPEFLNM